MKEIRTWKRLTIIDPNYTNNNNNNQTYKSMIIESVYGLSKEKFIRLKPFLVLWLESCIL